MANDWVKTTLGEIVKLGNGIIQTGPFGSQLHASDYVEEGVPVIMPLNIINNKIDLSGIARITKEDAERLSKHLVRKDDIVYSRRGDVTRKALITELEEGMFCGTGCLLVRPGNSIDARFLTYHLSSPINQEWIIRHAVGATMPNLNTGILKRVPLNLPSLDTQKAIAHILGSLDDKIELNRQMNETLEAMAQALFKSWFVDFDPVIDNALAAGNPIPDEWLERAEQRKNIEKKDNSDIQALFPDEFECTEEMGWIPEGWEVSEVGKILKRLKTKVKYKKDDVSDYGKVPVYEQGSDILLGFHNNEPDIKASNEDPAFIFGDHTCVTKLSLESFSISANVIPLRGKGYPTIWVYYAVQDKQSFEEYRRHWMELIVKPIISPSLKLTEIFSKHVESFGAKQMKIQYQNSDLAKLRDTLLPKLMSGELRISDAAAMVEEA